MQDGVMSQIVEPMSKRHTLTHSPNPTHTHIYIYICVYVCVCVRVCVCVCVFFVSERVCNVRSKSVSIMHTFYNSAIT